MDMKSDGAWYRGRARVTTYANNANRFVREHITPLFYGLFGRNAQRSDIQDVISEDQFWDMSGRLLYDGIRLKRFKLTDWFPRAPGVYSSSHAQRVRARVWSTEPMSDPVLGAYFSPSLKGDLIQEGGIGSIRLRPRRIAGEDYWLATALIGLECHGGIPLAIPARLLRDRSVNWGDWIYAEGQVRYLQDAGLDDIAPSVHHARPLVLFVDTLRGVATGQLDEPILITPVALFNEDKDLSELQHERLQYTFVQCAAGTDAMIDDAADWITAYAAKHSGTVITNFDEQRPLFADAPLSYQRLVTGTHDRTVIKHLCGPMYVDRVEQLQHRLHFTGDQVMGDKISTGDVVGSAVGRGAAVQARDITVFKQTLDQLPLDSELKRRFAEARDELDRCNLPDTDKNDVADDLAKLTEEVSKPEPSESRVKRLWGQIQAGAAPVAAILSGAASIAKLLGG